MNQKIKQLLILVVAIMLTFSFTMLFSKNTSKQKCETFSNDNYDKNKKLKIQKKDIDTDIYFTHKEKKDDEIFHDDYKDDDDIRIKEEKPPLNLEFLEIGTSDFRLWIGSKRFKNKNGLSVEPVIEYYEKLPDVENHIKLNVGISDKEETVYMFVIKPEIIPKFNLPNWFKGCSKIGNPNPSAIKYLVEEGFLPKHRFEDFFTVREIKCVSLGNIFKEYNVQSINHIKMDTEGYDFVILKSYVNFIKEHPELPGIKAKTIYFENNDSKAMEGVKTFVTDEMKKLGYKCKLGYNSECTR